MHFRISSSKWFHDVIKQALLTGYEIKNDPIMSSLLYTIQLSNHITLKKKARIMVDQSAVLIGVVDDLGILEANEIFCQINPSSNSFKKSKFFDDDRFFEEDKSNRQILNGEILVSRNPCTHPGDIRLLKAVDRPEFHYLTNVIVFPSKGERPLCNMMSGGDLDGDVYFVCWDQSITKHISPSSIQPAARYTKPDHINEKPAEEHIADYFIWYLERDVLGQLANLHLALCD